MLAAMQAFEDVGFDGPMRPDHVPTMAGEDNSNPGYHTKGRLFAVGYMRGLLEQTTANREGSEEREATVNPETSAD
jgi:mannonate dehydratase